MPVENDDKHINNKLFGAERLRVALSALVSGNQVPKIIAVGKQIQIVGNDRPHNFTKMCDFEASHFLT